MIKIFADGADFETMIKLNDDPNISGFTTNPTLMRKEGIQNYGIFAQQLLHVIKEKPISFEVFATEHDEIIEQAKKISSWGDNVYVKIPVLSTDRKIPTELIEYLASIGIKQNVTAVMNLPQVSFSSDCLGNKIPSVISIFAGRIYDTGEDASFFMREAMKIKKPSQKILWASPRQVYDYYIARELGVDIITMTPTLIEKLFRLRDKNLWQYSYETCQMFNEDAKQAGYTL